MADKGGGSVAGMFKDKRVQLAAGAVGVVGLVVLMRRGSGGGEPGPTVMQPAAGFDSSGTDLHNALNALGQGWQNDLREFTDQLGDIQDQLGKLKPPTTGPNPPPVIRPPTPPVTPAKPAPPKAPSWTPKPLYQSVAKYTSRNAPWNSTLSGIAGHYKTSVSTLMKLNPWIKNPDLIHPGQNIRYK